MPLKLATTRDCGGGVQFNAVITGTSITQPRAADSFLSVQQVRDGIRKKVRKQSA